MGRLFLIPTPLGNLEDLAPRSRRLLRELPVVFCEDTRTTGKLLIKLMIPSPSLIPLHDHNERKQVQKVLRRLDEGDVGLVSEAGTPVLSDPGFVLVRDVIAAGHDIVSVPGPCAAVAGLVGSGLPADRFLFLGFPPRSSAKRQVWFAEHVGQGASLVLYVSPHRAQDVLADAAEVLGDRAAAFAANLSKQGEAWSRGTLAALTVPPGELTLVIAGAEAPEIDWSLIDVSIAALSEVPAATVRDALAPLLDVPRRALYQRILDARR